MTAQQWVGEDDLVTGEAVALDLPPATIGVRTVSGLIDVALTAALLLVVTLLFSLAALETDAALSGAAQIVSTVLVLVGVPAVTETLTRGKTVGKLVTGLRTVRDDAGRISFRHALVRSLVGVVEIWLLSGVPAIVTAMANGKGKRVGDLVAGTYVVRDRFRLTLPPPVVMPPYLTGWAATADLTTLPTQLAVAVRQFLGRAAELQPQARAATADRLASLVQQHAAPAPPPGTHPEDFLAAVLCERRNRDLHRLAQERALRERLRERLDDRAPHQTTGSYGGGTS
ncbi:RDD family protein [Nocardioides caldifontis]|uniref:RDD family protein n=1 Tax=Nocardioides caldifontis TaxID=2588938 RepID=UPI0011DFAE99|nr:RDD family protein [Nocardioides caldifontis]